MDSTECMGIDCMVHYALWAAHLGQAWSIPRPKLGFFNRFSGTWTLYFRHNLGVFSTLPSNAHVTPTKEFHQGHASVMGLDFNINSMSNTSEKPQPFEVEAKIDISSFDGMVDAWIDRLETYFNLFENSRKD